MLRSSWFSLNKLCKESSSVMVQSFLLCAVFHHLLIVMSAPSSSDQFFFFFFCAKGIRVMSSILEQSGTIIAAVE